MTPGRISTLPAVFAIALTALTCSTAVNTTQDSSEPPPYRGMQEILDESAASDWRALGPENTLYMQLASGARVVIELAPLFAPEHVDNIRKLARAHFWDGLAVYRSQDNFVVQWGDPATEEDLQRSLAPALTQLPAEFDRSLQDLDFVPLADVDGWSQQGGFVQGFHAAHNDDRAWLTHCYGVVGAGRGAEVDSSTGAELYAIIGHAPRQLDRNITIVGRVVSGMEHLSVLPRGPAPMGMYASAEDYAEIRSVRVAADLAEEDRLNLEVLRTDTETFSDLVEARRNRGGGWYVAAAGYIDLCSVPIPVRETASEEEPDEPA